jgi:hypothetical protein
MATYAAEGVNYANYNSTPPVMVDVDQWGGRLRVMYDSYTESAVGDAGSTIKVGRLPKGARFQYGYVITSKSLSTAKYAITIGSTEVCAARTHTNATYDPQFFGKNAGTQLGAASDVTLTTSVAGTPGDAVIQVAIAYTVD